MLENMGTYPDFNAMKMLTLEKCQISSRYGNPNDENVRHHYLVQGNQYPHPDALQDAKNTLMKRKDRFELQDKTDGKHRNVGMKQADKVTISTARVNTQFSSKAIKRTVESFSSSGFASMNDYKRFSITHLGVLYLRKSERLALKWDIPNETSVRTRSSAQTTIANQIRLPPILIPSYGRSRTALLDLSDAMERNEGYVEIVIVRHEEQEEYLRTAFLHPALDVFVMKRNGHNTIGEARMVAKKLGEQITTGKNMEFVFLLDDNIINWQGVTLINDPCPMFGLEVSHLRSQRSDISLLKVLKHFTCKAMENFNIIGFSLETRGITKRKVAYGRKHVMAAVLLNLQKSKGIEYNPKAWAMEDIDFNLRTNMQSLSDRDQGVIVKCQRFVATKKKLHEGGVVPCDPPEDVKLMMKETEEWAGVTVKYKKEGEERNKTKQSVGLGNHSRDIAENRSGESEEILQIETLSEKQTMKLTEKLEAGIVARAKERNAMMEKIRLMDAKDARDKEVLAALKTKKTKY